jgi:aspartyl aminopeptidase
LEYDGGVPAAPDDVVADLFAFLDASPTPYHAVAESARRLERAGFARLDEADAWSLDSGARAYVTRGGSSLCAFVVGSEPPHASGFSLVGAHTDSPNLRVKPLADVVRHGYRQLAVDVYGSVLFSTWLDRDLSLAGRVVIEDGASGTSSRLVDFARPLLRIPNLAIHLDRKVNETGLVLNAQTHMVPVVGLDRADASGLRSMIAEERGRAGDTLTPDRIAGWDLCLYDAQRATRSGPGGEFVHAARLDNLASCYAALRALEGATGARADTRGVVLYDHEEVGSQSAQGAGSTFLLDVCQRLAEGAEGSGPDAFARAIARSFLISADMAHAVHPNYADKHDKKHAARIGKGPVIKINAGRSYASDAVATAAFEQACREAGFSAQRFVTRSDLPCGSTVGPITAAGLGMRAVDVGNPMLSMHSCRELAGAADVRPMIAALERVLAAPQSASPSV